MKLLPVDKLEPGMVLAQDIFVDRGTQAYMRAGAILTVPLINRMQLRGVQRAYVKDAPATTQPEAPAPSPLVQSAKSRVLVPPPVVDDVLKQEAVTSLQRAFTDIMVSDAGIYGPHTVLEEMDGVVHRLVGSLLRNRSALITIQNLKSFDDYTYHHSLSVAVLSIAIGQQLGVAAPQLGKLGLSAIMHDIGKTAVPAQLILKPARLSGQEYHIVQGHAKAGSAYLIGSSMGAEWMWSAVMHHHEKVDGSGYPGGLRGEGIPLYSRIISVADVYDALTSARPYRRPVQPAEALEYIMGGIDSAFDYDVVKALAKKVALYPVGSSVELSNGRLALVLDNENPLRPVVEILGSGEVVDLYNDRQYLSVVVRRVVDATPLSL